MEIALLLIIIVFVILIFSKQQKNILNSQIEIRNLSFKIDDLKKQLDIKFQSIKKDEVFKAKEADSKSIEELFVKPQIKEEVKPNIDSTFKNDESIIKTVSDNISQEKSKIINEQKEIINEQKEIINSEKTPVFTQMPFVQKKSWIEKFKEKNPDIEKFIGENLISKLGILILVLGISFFVKFAIDNDWINEPARVGIGILAGSIVMAVAHRLRKSFTSFSSVFVAGAVSIFYFTIGIAFHDYHLFNQTIAFIIMVFITIFSALVSVAYNRKELAILTLIAGFAVPFMVSTGEGNYQVLFTYIVILNIGMLVISYYKKWNIVTVLSFVFTYALFSSWFVIEFNNNQIPYKGVLAFASLFYFIFCLATVVNNVRNKGSFTKIEYFLLLANTFIYFGIGATVFQNWQVNLKGVFTISLAIYNLIFALVLYRKFGINKNAIFFLLGLALTFVTLTIPFQFNGNYITLFWACEAVLLLWLSQKSKISTFKIGGIVVQILMVISLLIDWIQKYSFNNNESLNPLLNKIFITGLVCLISLILTYILLKKEKETTKFYFISLDPKIYQSIVLVSAIVLGYLIGMLEITYQANQYFVNSTSAISYSIVYHYLFTAILIFFLFKYKNSSNKVLALILIGLNILIYFISHKLIYNEIVSNFSFGYNNKSAFINHYIILACLIFCFYVLFKNRKEKVLSSFLQSKLMLWIFTFCIVFILSNEIMVHAYIYSVDDVKALILAHNESGIGIDFVNNSSRNELLNSELLLVKKRVIKVGFPILWGLLSFIFLIIGIKKQIKQLRIIALSLLGLTIFKLFIYDIQVSGPGRIIAFILLGILILIISFAYQKLNKKESDKNKT